MTKEKEYTEHTAEIVFADGTDREITFDVMERGDAGITFKDYTGAEEQTHDLGRLGTSARTSVRFTSEAWLFVPYANLGYVETTERETKSKEYETVEEVPTGVIE